MILLNIRLNNIYGFRDFTADLKKKKKVVNSFIEDEHLAGRPRFRYKKAVVLIGANATGKTSFGKALLRIFRYIESGDEKGLYEMVTRGNRGEFSIDFVNEGYILNRISAKIDPEHETIDLGYLATEIRQMDSYEMCVDRLQGLEPAVINDYKELKGYIGKINYRFAYPEIEKDLKLSGINNRVLLKTLRAVVGTLDPTLKDVSIAKDLKNSFVIRRGNEEIIIQDGKLLNREALSSGTVEGIDVAAFLASMRSDDNSFYYCDEHFSYIHSDIEKRIFGIMLYRLGDNEQLIFTTHNMDMLDLNLPKHSYGFLRRERDDTDYDISIIFASEVLKRNTDSVRSAVENDVFLSLPDDSLLDELEVDNEQ